MSVVDQLYDLIQVNNSMDTFNNNIELFREFYYHNMSIRYEGEKVLSIYAYLLSLNIDEDHELMPYINSKIFDDFNKYEQYVTQSFYYSGIKADDSSFMKLISLMDAYDDFSKYADQGSLNTIVDYGSFMRDVTASMMVILNSSFFELSNENIMTMIDTIKNNYYLESIISEGKMGDRLLDKDYIFEYVSRFLCNQEFINEDFIDNDLVIQAIKGAKITDKNTFKKIIGYMNNDHLLLMIDGDISLLTDILENTFEDEVDRVELFDTIYDKLSNGNSRMLLDYIINDDRSTKYISDERKEEIINEFLYHYPGDITDDEVDYILDHGANEIFLINLKSDINDNTWDEETRNRVMSMTEDIEDYDYDLDSSIDVLSRLFAGDESVNELMVGAASKTLIRTYLDDDEIKIYYVVDDDYYGCAYNDEKTVVLNYKGIEQLTNERDYERNPEALHIIETCFHEARHIEQFDEDRQEDLSEELLNQHKEDVLVSILANYYHDNYIGISYERDARIVGAQSVVDLLKIYFPDMEKVISHYEKKVESEKSVEPEKKKLFELSDEQDIDDVLGKLVSINPGIVDEYDFLKVHYSDGISDNKKEELNEMLKDDNVVVDKSLNSKVV